MANIEQHRVALRLCVASLDNLLPGVARIPADIGLLNDALLTSRRVLDAEPEDPAALRVAAREVLRALKPLNVSGRPVVQLDTRLNKAVKDLEAELEK